MPPPVELTTDEDDINSVTGGIVLDEPEPEPRPQEEGRVVLVEGVSTGERNERCQDPVGPICEP